MKRVISAFLIFATIFVVACPVQAAEPRYANASILTVSMSIGSSGTASIVVRMSGNTASAQVSVSTYVEKKVGTTWTRVDLGTTNDVWEYTTANASLIKAYTAQLSSTGEYRAVAEFTLTGTTVEKVTKTATATY